MSKRKKVETSDVDSVFITPNDLIISWKPIDFNSAVFKKYLKSQSHLLLFDMSLGFVYGYISLQPGGNIVYSTFDHVVIYNVIGWSEIPKLIK